MPGGVQGSKSVFDSQNVNTQGRDMDNDPSMVVEMVQNSTFYNFIHIHHLFIHIQHLFIDIQHLFIPIHHLFIRAQHLFIHIQHLFYSYSTFVYSYTFVCIQN